MNFELKKRKKEKKIHKKSNLFKQCVWGTLVKSQSV